MRLIIGLMFLGSMMMNAQNSCFAWNLKYSYDLMNMDVVSNEEMNQLKGFDPVHTWGFGLKRSMGTIDHLFNLGADVMYGQGKYKSHGLEVKNTFVSYSAAFNLSYEMALGIKSIAHVYKSYSLLVFEASHRWKGYQLYNHYSSLEELNTFLYLDKSSFEFSAGIGRRMYFKRKYKGTLSAKLFTDLPSSSLRSSLADVEIYKPHVFGVRVVYSVSS